MFGSLLVEVSANSQQDSRQEGMTQERGGEDMPSWPGGGETEGDLGRWEGGTGFPGHAL